MKGVHFFLEYANKTEKNKATRKKLGNHRGTVVAVFHESQHRIPGTDQHECFGAVQDIPDSAVCGTSASYQYLREQCLRISEAQAREIHPTLFKVLDV